MDSIQKVTYESSVVVTADKTAAAMGSGDMEVFATPAMVALMENAAMLAVAGQLAPGTTTVGTRMDVAHLKATPVGDHVTARAELESDDGRKLTFRVEAFDSVGMIGQGVHERYRVDRERFLSKLQKR